MNELEAAWLELWLNLWAETALFYWRYAMSAAR